MCLLLQKTFAMDPINGVIKVNSALNRDYVVEMSFEILVEDVASTAIGRQTATCKFLLSDHELCIASDTQEKCESM